MTPPDLFCPLCSGYVNMVGAAVITIRRSSWGIAHELNLTRVLACDECAMVTEVNTVTGELLDLGNITVSDIMVPTDRARVFASVTAVPLMHGRES